MQHLRGRHGRAFLQQGAKAAASCKIYLYGIGNFEKEVHCENL